MKNDLNLHQLQVQSFAKFNPFLKIHPPQKSLGGYHPLNLGFQFLNLSDSLQFITTKQSGIELKINPTPQAQTLLNENPQSNLIIKAYETLKAESSFKQGVRVELRKHIPLGAGLGGGSSNAATTLLALNLLLKLNIPSKKLTEIASSLGSDVGFFLQKRSVQAKQFGQILKPFNFKEGTSLLIYPNLVVSTAKMFSQLKFSQPSKPRKQFRFLKENKILEVLGKNDFESLARKNPAIEAIFNCVDELNTLNTTNHLNKGGLNQPLFFEAILCGSGSAVLVYGNKQSALSQRAITQFISHLNQPHWLILKLNRLNQNPQIIE